MKGDRPRKRLVELGALGIAVVVLVVSVWHHQPAPPNHEKPAAEDRKSEPVQPEAVESVELEVPLHVRPAGSQLSGYGDYDPHYDLRLVAELLESYLLLVKGAERSLPPVADNAELVRVLIGNNPDYLQFLSPTSPHLDGRGRLVDQWGAPLHFHFVSRSTVDIRSAGPDGELWSGDDLTAQLGEPHPWL